MSFTGLLLLACVLVVGNAVRRSRAGRARVEQHGWRRLPDDADVTAGWNGWPFLAARKPGRSTDVVTGNVDGVEFVSLRWVQSEPGRGRSRTEIERYNIVGLRCETDLPHLSVVRGNHRVRPGQQVRGVEEVETGSREVDRRWQLLGDQSLADDLLVPEAVAVMEELGGAWVFQPGWVTRVVRWSFWSGEDAMVAELRRAAAPWRQVPQETWSRWGGTPDFLTRLGEAGPGETPPGGPGRGWD